MRVLIAGGGTGGHFYPALAVIEEFERHASKVKLGYVGTKRGIEARVLPSYRHVSFFRIHVRGLKRNNFLQNLGAFILLGISFLETMTVFLRFRPNVVIGMGGYSSFPAVFIASLFGKVLPVRTVIHEQNALAGLTNRFLGHFVDKVLVSYPQTRSQFSSARKVVVTGNPIRSEFFLARRTPETYNRFNLYPDKKTVLIFGGSNGSSALTSAVRHEALEISKRTDIQVLLVTGRDQDTSTLELEFAAAGIKNIAVKTYIKSMGEAFAIADLVVSRAGASSLAEITSCGKPSILIPWKEAADGHQEANAQVLKVSNACEIMDESELGNHQLAQLIEEMVQDKEGLRLMARRAVYMGAKHAAASMLGEIVGLVEGAKT